VGRALDIRFESNAALRVSQPALSQQIRERREPRGSRGCARLLWSIVCTAMGAPPTLSIRGKTHL
jgi:hypothetical protein